MLRTPDCPKQWPDQGGLPVQRLQWYVNNVTRDSFWQPKSLSLNRMEVSETAKGGHLLSSMTEKGLTLLPQTIEKQTKDLRQGVQTQDRQASRDNDRWGKEKMWCILITQPAVWGASRPQCRRGAQAKQAVLKGKNSVGIQGGNDSYNEQSRVPERGAPHREMFQRAMGWRVVFHLSLHPNMD